KASLAITLAGAFFSNRASTSAHIVRVFLTEFQRILPKTLKGMALTAGHFGRSGSRPSPK
ncbi:hypothetical protein, partial [Pseudomonas sp. RW409]|uniref:hypothetical protein n=1 Tax=Pseudomonas sp. RW409 TaxID=2202895 RepID=UPI001C448397